MAKAKFKVGSPVCHPYNPDCTGEVMRVRPPSGYVYNVRWIDPEGSYIEPFINEDDLEAAPLVKPSVI